MIKSVYVNGLKSLKGVKIDLLPGLNVLVGPNGSGKSNILTAFELISKLGHLDSLNPYDYVGSTDVQGLFDAYGKDKKIDLAIDGKIEKHIMKNLGASCNSLNYRYECSIHFDLEFENRLYFSKQFLELNTTQENCSETKKLKMKFDNNKITIEECDDFYKKHFAGEIFNGKSKNSWVKTDYLNILYINKHQELKYKSMIHDLCLYFEPLIFAIKYFDSGKVFNMNPASIRQNMSKKLDPNISQNGSGLMSALLRICENRKGKTDTTFEMNGNGVNYQNTYNIVLALLKNISPQIVDLDVEFNANEQKIVGNILYEEKDEEVKKTSIELVSGGSLKWLSLIAALLINKDKSLFVLEEPENYLHPSMQQLTIDFMRETLEDDNEIRLFSTHSETILNMLNPEEVILTYYLDGQTLTQKIEDPEILNKAIEETGFGIGSQLVAGSFDYDNINY